MKKILGIDLGTNSIGLCLRNENVFDWFGVYTFKKGVGIGKSGEFSFAGERTKYRSSRRHYNARRYRKWETLSVLVKNGFCPLPIEELNKWKHYSKGKGRIFPVTNEAFNKWLKLDFNNDNIPDYKSPYQLRSELVTIKLNINNQIDKYKIGRALYHIAQRRGFKSSRKNGETEISSVYKGSGETQTIGRNDYAEIINSHISLGSAFAYLENKGERIRNRYTLRTDYLNEVKKIFDLQNIEQSLCESIIKAIFYQRPLRTQKGLIGRCTLEVNKYRCPISHPKFESFRAWSFINTIKCKVSDYEEYRSLPYDLKFLIYNQIFFRKKTNFKFLDIQKFIEKNAGKEWILNYKNESNVAGCPVSARLKAVFGDKWESTEILSSEFKKNRRGVLVEKKYSIEDIWHIMFSYDDVELFEEFLFSKLKLSEDQVKEMTTIFNSFPIGYANLSLKAINNIMPFLEEGLIYSEAVILAKIPEIIGPEIFFHNKNSIIEDIKKQIELNRDIKTKLSITNSLISAHYSENFNHRAKGLDSEIMNMAKKDVYSMLKKHFGEKSWNNKNLKEQDDLYTYILEKYLKFLDGKQSNIEKSSYNKRVNPETDYYRLPHLLDQIKLFLKNKFEINEKKLNILYHPSQVEYYIKQDGQEFLKSPKTAAFKNPMAYKTLYRLRDVLNHLIEIGKIDSETKIVIEIARDLNNSNLRNAIELYQRRRESENKEFSIAISELIKDPEFCGSADPNSSADKNKFRLWVEQLDNNDDIIRLVQATKDDLNKYRLWKEQNCQCMYTGRIISITDLFNSNMVDFEHTIPRSKCFDNSLANLTVCYADYNRNVKKNKIPKELDNYEFDTNQYSAIRPRLKKWKEKIYDLKNKIESLKFKSKLSTDKKSKDIFIRDCHIYKFELDYWINKVDRFEREDIPQGFVNSQLNDTQIITKYAYHYLRTIFNKVEVQKGNITSEFRKIYQIQNKYEKKNRTKHYHHAIDAAVLTLIPESSKREEILKKAYLYEESAICKQYHEAPFKGFHQSMITDIERNLLINNIVNQDQTFTIGKKIVRKRGRIVWLKDKYDKPLLDSYGNKIPKIAQGDSIRGQLHEQTFFGKIKVVKRDESNNPMRDANKNYIYDKNDVYKYVIRTPIEKITDLSKIVDPFIAQMIIKQMDGKSLTKTISDGVWMLDKKGNKVNQIKKVRTWSRISSLMAIKEQTYKSSKEYKRYYYANTGDNYAFALYISQDGKKAKIISRNLFEISKLKIQAKNYSDCEIFASIDEKSEYKLYHIFRPGQKVLFYKERKEELLDLESLSNRLYYVRLLFDSKQGLIQFQHHLDARNDDQLLHDFPKETFGQKGKNGFSRFSDDFVQPRLLLSVGNLNCVIENKDFIMNLNGKIEFLF